MKKITLFLMITLSSVSGLFAQANINYLDKTPYFMINAGPLFPGDRFSSTTENGLFAKNGFQLGFDINYIIGYGIGVGFKYEFNSFGFDRYAFLEHSQADFIQHNKTFASSKFGLNVLFNLPLQLGSDDFVLNLYGVGNAGLRTMNIPEINLEYDELSNKYVEVAYRPRSSTFGYLGYTAGIQFFFLEKYGINLSYNAIMDSRHSINYSVRKFDANGQLYEDENYLHDELDHFGVQIGFIFLFGK